MTVQPVEKPINKFEVLRLWRAGHDTSVISKRMGCKEAAVANALAEMRDREHSR